MRKISIILSVLIFSVSAINAGMIYVPSTATDNAKAGLSVVAPLTSNNVVVQKKHSKGKLFAKIFKNKIEKIVAKGKRAGDKSKVVAALLAFFLGGFGVHDFYLGNKKAGFIKLGATLIGLILVIVGYATAVASLETGVIAFPVLAIVGSIILTAVSIWALVDFIRILTGSYEPVDGSYSD